VSFRKCCAKCAAKAHGVPITPRERGAAVVDGDDHLGQIEVRAGAPAEAPRKHRGSFTTRQK
jgi:hypothetical protein